MSKGTESTVVTIVGTRPEIIRLSRIIPKLDKTFNHVFVHTGQNKDPMLNDVFFKDLDLRAPDVFLDVDTSSLGAVLGDTLKKIEAVFLKHEPDAVLILGDTNSAISAVLAKRMHIPVYHMEAGNRSFDENVPEETNRRLVDHVSDFNLPYTEHARRNLLTEGIHPRRIMMSGSPMREVLDHYRSKIEASSVLADLGLEKGNYFLVSAHRQENVDSSERLRDLLDSLEAIHEEWGLPLMVSTHPRTRKQLEAIPGYKDIKGVTFHEPFGFLDYNNLQLNAKCVISDSGTISEESTILGFPAITIRDSIERPEAVDFGGIVMTGLKAGNVLSGITEALASVEAKTSSGSHVEGSDLPQGYEVTDCSSPVVKFMLSTITRHHDWAGIRRLG
jgi:UDP-N-acetylglucosamine 2-epimerase (non-hydrolysing)